MLHKDNIYLFLTLIACFLQNTLCSQYALVNTPALNIYIKPDTKSSLETQELYGHTLDILSSDNQWANVKTKDNSKGYVKIEHLILSYTDNSPSNGNIIISSVCARIYPIADTELPAILELPFNSIISLKEPLASSDKRWIEVNLLDGSSGWIQRGDVKEFSPLSMEEMIHLSFMFLNRPYIWGGKSSFGYDCSGFIQTLFSQMDYLLPRNSSQQVNSSLLIPIDKTPKRGDILFFGASKVNHVGLYLGDHQFIHSGVSDNKPWICVADLRTTKLNLLAIRRLLIKNN